MIEYYFRVCIIGYFFRVEIYFVNFTVAIFNDLIGEIVGYLCNFIHCV